MKRCSMTDKVDKKTLLKNVNFDFEASDDRPLGAHIHYTLGAASLMDEPLLLKSKDKLTEDEAKILEKVNKNKKETIMEKDVKKGYEDKISDLEKKLERLSEIEKELKKSNVEKSIKDLPFEDDLNKEILEAMIDFDEKTIETISKAFTFLKDFKEEVQENEIQKQLQEEAGADGEAKVVVKSLSEQIADARKKGDK